MPRLPVSSEWSHWLKKLRKTLNILSCLFLARMFGEYIHSVGGHDTADYAVYRWSGKTWMIPTGPIEEN